MGKPMTYKQFQALGKDWNLSDHFKESMRVATTKGSDVAKINPHFITITDMRWLDAHGFELNVKMREVEL